MNIVLKDIVLLYIAVWKKHYEESVGDGKGQAFFDWCVKTYKPIKIEEDHKMEEK